MAALPLAGRRGRSPAGVGPASLKNRAVTRAGPSSCDERGVAVALVRSETVRTTALGECDRPGAGGAPQNRTPEFGRKQAPLPGDDSAEACERVHAIPTAW